MKKQVKKIIACFLAAALGIAGLIMPAAAEESPSFKLRVTVFPQAAETTVDLWFDAEEGCLRLFLPAQCDTSALPVHFSGANRISVDGTALANGETTGIFSVGEHTLTCDGKTYPLTVLRSAALPSVFIETESGSLDQIQADKDYKEPGSITVFENGIAVIENAALKSVKGRGNSTWHADKKPYNIKFEKKTSILGMAKAKKWTLLANHFDDSLLRNSVALDIAKAFGLPFTSEYRMADLYANGEYQGNYLIVESVEVGDNRVEITDLQAANEEANPDEDIEAAEPLSRTVNGIPNARKWMDIYPAEDITGGYLLEAEFPDRYKYEASGFITPKGQCIVLKSPEYASRIEVNYIAELYEEMERALYAPDGYNTEGKHYSEYFDMDQLVKMYILMEYTFHRDAGLSSCYFYKDAGKDTLHAGPAWDFDLSLGNINYSGGLPFYVGNAESWWANSLFCYDSEEQTQTVFALLYRHEDFRARVSEQWPALAAKIDDALALLPQMTDAAAPSAVMNALRWNLLSGNTPEEKEASYRKAADKLRTFTAARRTALNKGFGADAAMVYYDANGGNGTIFNGTMLSVGDTVVLREINHKVTPITAPDGYYFAGWNTAADGSGKQYRALDKAQITKKTTVFYAQWRRISADPPQPTEADGDYSPGDIDLDRYVTASDARLALRAAVELQALDAVLQQLADVDEDGAVTASDARLILRAAVALESLPDKTVFVPAGHERPY